ncbi:MAG: SIS domain-containing protein [Actinobacteria bacterium]|nr:SIS domain-containing protein [Actinomycetota bacterium]
MCGIIAVIERRPDRTPLKPAVLRAELDAAADCLAVMPSDVEAARRAIDAAVCRLDVVDQALRGPIGVSTLLFAPGLVGAIEVAVGDLGRRIEAIEAALDAGELTGAGRSLEQLNASLVALKDIVWAIGRDRLPTAMAVRDLARVDGAWEVGAAGIGAFTTVQVALSSLDRLEVRGRDSAGLHLLVDGHGLDLESDEIKQVLADRADPLFTSGAVRVSGSRLGFVYKAAAEIGELGDNTAALRAAICSDDLLHRALTAPSAQVSVLGHTRWASVGVISEPNAHPLDNTETAPAQPDGQHLVAVLNGDVDNHADLAETAGLHISGLITTDAKVIPALVARRRAQGMELGEAFTSTVETFEGSVAIGVCSAEAPDELLLALRGSGQALYIGLADDAFVVASEPYGVVEETARFVRMDGETPRGADGTPGEVVVLSRAGAGTLSGIVRTAYDGTPLPIRDDEVHVAEITTRDIDRGKAPHFLLKEISEAPQSIVKTLRGRIGERDGHLVPTLSDEVLPSEVADRLARGEIRRVLVIGQGTAAVAGQSMAATLAELVGDSLVVGALPATELSGFGLADDMTNTLVVAISQSGTTTDTNRTVDLVRGRGAAVIAIVNRRNSDLCEKADGVLYTSDGRDVEMSVASTKAFYAQVAAGVLLASGIAVVVANAPGARGVGGSVHNLLLGLRRLPEALQTVLGLRPEIARAAREHAPSRRYWAVVGNGRNRIAAEELRIKLSELCYKAIACDATEDKKHIDLSSEPMILVCAAGLGDATADDVAKEVAIYRAHKAAPIVITTGPAERYSAALQVITVPSVHPALDFLPAAMVGHLFGYEAALAIDALALPLRAARGAVETVILADLQGDHLLAELAENLTVPAGQFFAGLASGSHDGQLEASTAVSVASMLRYATGVLPLDLYELEHGRIGSPSVLMADLLSALTKAIDELTRPIDAIKHQAKTVTVGISRAEDTFVSARLVQEVLAAGAARDRLGYRVLRTLSSLDPVVMDVTGYTRYRVEGNVADGSATLHVLDKGGVAAGLTSRAESDPRLLGTKHRAAVEREVTVAQGGHDGRSVVLVPEVKGAQVVAITLLHVELQTYLSSDLARQVLTGYRGRYSALVDAVTETEPFFRDELLAEVPMIELLVEPVRVLAERWQRL